MCLECRVQFNSMIVVVQPIDQKENIFYSFQNRSTVFCLKIGFYNIFFQLFVSAWAGFELISSIV